LRTRLRAGLGARLRRHGVRVAITVAGFGVVLAGVAMLVLPGPGLVTIALGFGLLGREYRVGRCRAWTSIPPGWPASW
jgi:hypothetical protein